MPIVQFTVIDLETGGIAPPASVIEIGHTIVLFETETKEIEIGLPHHKLFKPAGRLSSDNIAVHHLTEAMLAPYELCERAHLEAVARIRRPNFLVAANCAFEQQWFTPEICRRDDGEPRWICTVKGAARLMPEAPSHSNQAIRYELGLDLDEGLAMPPHRAGPDSYVTACILATWLINGVRVRDLVQWTLEPRYMTKLPFGKHKGQRFDAVPRDYLEWLVKQADMDGDAKHWARVELDRRDGVAGPNNSPGDQPPKE
ncbi:MAG: DUF3820 family protein [Hyphomonadaceae bacterium]|nr:DUF3820 family protein [Hyphomonadaceae bacterium]